MRIPLKEGDRVYSTGVFLVRCGEQWVVDSFEEDTYFDGECVEDIEKHPYIEVGRDECQDCRKLGETICPGQPNRQYTDCYEGGIKKT